MIIRTLAELAEPDEASLVIRPLGMRKIRRTPRQERAMPGWIGPAELIPSILVVLPIFGPKRLPEMGAG